ncbi:TruB: tRNA pseudouridine synthase B [Desulfosarcina variabilis str. Montpellier]|uniref:tRNA pseudouridine(55) synthase TruB n=1 Tax=Desulfosarcina variabilis TaxID=2300 RepID=UPI003AFA11C0
MPSELSGIVVVDKPEGISSAGIVARVKKLSNARKVGHAGTLDPLATGVLICCLNRATRLSQFLLKGDKTYAADLVLGTVTDTQDATGTIVEQHSWADVTEDGIRTVAAGFLGKITQIPPVYSALKHKGTPLYKLARRGKAVEKPGRSVWIKRLEILAIDLPVVRFVVCCSSGTYVRTLCADIGRALGCGGHLKRLRRTASSGFSVQDAWQLDQLAQLRETGRLAQAVIPMNAALPFMPAVVADKDLANKIKHGMPLVVADFDNPLQEADQGVFKVVDEKGCLIAVLGESQTPGGYNYCCVFSA